MHVNVRPTRQRTGKNATTTRTLSSSPIHTLVVAIVYFWEVYSFFLSLHLKSTLISSHSTPFYTRISLQQLHFTIYNDRQTAPWNENSHFFFHIAETNAGVVKYKIRFPICTRKWMVRRTNLVASTFFTFALIYFNAEWHFFPINCAKIVPHWMPNRPQNEWEKNAIFFWEFYS